MSAVYPVNKDNFICFAGSQKPDLFIVDYLTLSFKSHIILESPGTLIKDLEANAFYMSQANRIQRLHLFDGWHVAIPEHVLVKENFFTKLIEATQIVEVWDEDRIYKIAEFKIRTATCPLRERMVDNLSGKHIYSAQVAKDKLKALTIIDQLSYNLINRTYYFFEALKNKEEFAWLLEKIKQSSYQSPVLMLAGEAPYTTPFDLACTNK